MPQAQGIKAELAQAQGARATGQAPQTVVAKQATPQAPAPQTVSNPDGLVQQLMQQRAQQSEALPQGIEVLNSGLPGHERNKTQEVAPVPTQETAPPVEQAPIVARIGDKEFTNTEDAITYANELQLAKSTDEAYIDGLKQGHQLTPQQPATPQVDPISKAIESVNTDQMFEDPKAFLTEFAKTLINTASEQIHGEITSKQQQEKGASDWWDTLYSTYPDLAKNKKHTEYLLNSNINEFSNLSPNIAIKKFGEYAINQISELKKTYLPETVLPSAPATTTGTGQQGVSLPQAPVVKENVDFVSQLRNNSNVGSIKG